MIWLLEDVLLINENGYSYTFLQKFRWHYLDHFNCWLNLNAQFVQYYGAFNYEFRLFDIVIFLKLNLLMHNVPKWLDIL